MLINIPVVNQDDDMTPEFFNTRFGIIADAINGNLDDDNLADNAVQTSKIADDAVTAAEIEPQQDWIAPTFLNSWVNYGNPWANAGYMKDSLGFVHLRGIIKSGTINTTAFTLPAGYRPATSNQDELFIVHSSGAIGRIDIKGDGTVLPVAGNNSDVSLAGITFKAGA